MLYDSFVLSNGQFIVPRYLSRDEKLALKEKIEQGKLSLACGCRKDFKETYLFSKDLKVYPAHRNFTHLPSCVRSLSKENMRKSTALILDNESSDAVLFLKFSPFNFSVPVEGETVHVSSSSSSSGNDEKEVLYGLKELIETLNREAFNFRVFSRKPMLSADYFLTYFFGKLKHIRIDGMKKALLDYKLADDGLRFFYAPLESIDSVERDDGGVSHNITFHSNGDFKNRYFVYSKTLCKAMESFEKRYGMSYADALGHFRIYVAGFIYKRITRKTLKKYTVIGRVHLFLVSSCGIYCDSINELTLYERLAKKSCSDTDFFYLPAEDLHIAARLVKAGNYTDILREDDCNLGTDVVSISDYLDSL